MNFSVIAVICLFLGTFAHAGNLNIKVGPQKIYALPIGITSCSGHSSQDILAPSFMFTTFNYQWTGSEDFKMDSIVVQLSGDSLSNGSYKCVIAGKELSVVTAASTGSIAGGNNSIFSETCAIRCGGLSVRDGVSSALIQGLLTVNGTASDKNGSTKPVTTSVPVSVQYDAP